MRKFGPDTFEETQLSRLEDLASFRDPSCCLWVEVTGLADASAIAAIGRTFDLHVLSIEDVLDPTQRAKVEQYGHYTFVVLKTLAMARHVESHQLNIFLGDHFVITLQDQGDPALALVRDRMRHARGKIRDRGADYLTYAIIDTVIDHYFPVAEALDDHLESVEDTVLEGEDIDPVSLARHARRDLQTIRHAVWPALDSVTLLLHEGAAGVTDETRVHLRDCYDHIVQLQDMVESSREIAAGLLDAYLSKVTLKTNEVMKVLTVIATIFIPLSFITDVYELHFDPRSSPVITWYWGYPLALLVILAIVTGSLLYFRNKGWFGGSNGSGA